MHTARDLYIPAGCLGLGRDEAGIDDEAWALLSSRSWWSCFRRPSPALELLEADVSRDLLLPPGVQESIFKLRVNPVDSSKAVVRVHLLPDDTHRSLVDRSSRKLRNARVALLRILDYSKEAWLAQTLPLFTGMPSAPSSGLDDAGDDDAGDDESLLRMFNRIRSPNPDPSLVEEPHLRDAMCDLLDSMIPGLTTELYPYQRRSAALMLQRESQPGTSIDPRLISVQDQSGSPWYMDPVAGTVLAGPRFYDGVFGGILAEEMGSGKTAICLALIVATKNFPTKAPELYARVDTPVRKGVASLADMAASCASRHAVPWKSYFEHWRAQFGYEFGHCIEAMKRHPGYYIRPAPRPQRQRRRHSTPHPEPPEKIYLSSATVVIVPTNLVSQWRQEIEKHTTGLKVRVLVRDDVVPGVEELLDCDIILFSQSRFEKIERNEGFHNSALGLIHFKRCIFDEGHKLGSSATAAPASSLWD